MTVYEYKECIDKMISEIKDKELLKQIYAYIHRRYARGDASCAQD